MKSYTTRVKEEILSDKVVRARYKNQQSYGFMVFARSFSAGKMEILTRERKVAAAYRRLVQSVLPLRGTVTLREERPAGALNYRVTVDDFADRCALHNHFAMLYPEGVTYDLLGGDGGAGAFLGGVFLACGALSDPRTKFHLEFSLSREDLADALAGLLGEVGFRPLRSRRGKRPLVYFNESSRIEDLLTLSGAPLRSMELMNFKIVKEIRNGANRAANCDAANIDRQAKAAREQLNAIRSLGADTLPAGLAELARLRLDCPFDSLRELGLKCVPPLSRSGVHHRMERILALAGPPAGPDAEKDLS